MVKYSWFRCLPSRHRRSTTVFGACTIFFVSGLLFNKLFLNNAANCIANCSTAIRYRSYERLQKNEASKRVKHPVVKTFDVNFLGSNSPIEDRFVAGFSKSSALGIFSVIDGHKGFHCSQFIQNHILQYLSSSLAKVNDKFLSDLEVCLSMNETEGLTVDWIPAEPVPLLLVEECLTSSFNSLDNNISSQALSDVKLILQGHSMSREMKERVMRAIEGACVTVAMVQPDSVSVATTGDCRVVLGQQGAGDQWQALPLSVDQNAMNENEVKRLKNAHPGEEGVIFNGRVLGSLMPFRSFGDVDFKWDTKYLEGIVPVWPNYQTPPYITAEPVVTHHKITPEDKFIVIASDGLWERISNEDAVKVVSDTLKSTQQQSFSFFNHFSRKDDSELCCAQNAATQLLWHALGGKDEDVTRLLDVAPEFSRMVRDDITIIVVFFH